MKHPTIEDLTKILSDHAWSGGYHEDTAAEIHALYNPAMKPLSELANDDEACRKIFELILPGSFEIKTKSDEWALTIEGRDGEGESFGELIIDYYGNCQAFDWISEGKDYNPFLIVDKIRSLGYEPSPETTES